MKRTDAPSRPLSEILEAVGVYVNNFPESSVLRFEDLRQLEACIREQQAALQRCVRVLESDECKHTDKIGMIVTLDCADSARATLAKWSLP